MKQPILAGLLGLSLVLGACTGGDTASEVPAEATAETVTEPTVELVAATAPATAVEVPSLGEGEQVAELPTGVAAEREWGPPD